MSDVRRRKVRNESEGLSDTSYEDNIKNSEVDVDLNTTNDSAGVDGADSEYETVGESGSESEDLNDDRDNPQELSEKDDCEEGSIILDLERQSGDGEEQDNEKKKVDDDEDRSNPQYIPKRGTFYEHDDRTAEDGVPDGAETTVVDSEQETSPHTEKVVGKVKKVWQQSHDRWSHDRYDEDEQAPKSRSELIAAYGYDIRNEEGPPKARRRHRYGHGPNKYTRNWEDLEAYGKQKIPQRKPKPEDFPALHTEKNTSVQSDAIENADQRKSEDGGDVSRSRQQNYQNSPDYINKQSNESRPRPNRNNRFNKTERKERRINEQNENVNKSLQSETKDFSGNEQEYKNKRGTAHEKNSVANNSNTDDRRLSNRAFKNRNTLEFKSQNRSKTSNMQMHNSQNMENSPISNHYEQVSENEIRKNLYDAQGVDPEVDNIVSQSYCNTKLKNDDNITSNKYAENNRPINAVNRNSGSSGNATQKNANSVPPRMQTTETAKPKRYSILKFSSLRQRPEQEANNIQNQQVYQQSFYPTDYPPAQGNDPNINLANNVHQTHIPPQMNPLQQPVAQATPGNMSVPPPQTMPYVPETVPTQVITTSNQVMPQQVLAPQYPPNTMQFGSAGPYMAPSNTFLQQSLGYPVPPPQHAAATQYPPQYPTYPAPAAFSAVPNPPAAGPPMFQPQGGITYYSPQGQPLPPRMAPRRPRSSAIPIVPPPPSVPNDTSPPTDNASDAESAHNIDHILDNMFVQRHPYDPATAGNLCGINAQVQEMTITESAEAANPVTAVENEYEQTNAQTTDQELDEKSKETPTVAD